MKRRDLKWLNSALRYRVEKWVWIIFVPLALIFGLINSVAVVSLLSIYALVISAASAEQAAEAKEIAQKQEHPKE